MVQPKTNSFFLLVIFSTLWYGNLSVSCNTAGTKIKKALFVSADSIFFSLKNSDTLKKKLVLYNKSENLIKITGIENGCGCTVAIINDSTIKSSDSSFLQITYIPQISKDSGDVLRYITIKSNTIPAFKNIILKGKVLP